MPETSLRGFSSPKSWRSAETTYPRPADMIGVERSNLHRKIKGLE